ncbi:MAG TPA: SDR family oxidoreductase [Solimonas sp.]|nr:SDR family oxidoreductase [Solimonas sp.]
MNGASAFDLHGRLALVTGAGNGIGAGIAGVLARSGATVVIADRDGDAAARTVDALRGDGHTAHAVTVDLADEASIVAACAAVIAAHGTPWLLVNNAGLQDRELLLDVSAAEWDRMMTVNARAPLLMTREIGRAMVAAGHGGRIVNIASNSALTPAVLGLASYASSKGALLSLSLTSAFELAEHGITVNSVLPGGVATPGAIAACGPATAGPARRKPPLGMCEPEDIGAAVLFFASKAARYVTSQMLAVDAGASLT